ncbi:uncharacterized protein BJ212DRAFT_1295721 [Suillus subaureus]|uniref:Uncharacterized protein n=1 Tax=Suillus subaureus TaxID=48587 RepID=A0A9P7ELR6_9AGAM|nr:uncharacterized protein BJ212DRAFT_1295721 [Suillus subaureus]KAG1824585.1 hypothetical protein BJ212DRAFT_1295721 [Suillus subaureus]
MNELTIPELAEWKKFMDEIMAIDTNKLWEKMKAAQKKKDMEKAQNTYITRLENLQIDAVEYHIYAMSPEEWDMLRKHVEEIPHHQNNAAGRAAYKEQLKQWFATNSQDGKVTEGTPFSLQPGSAMICSGECFRYEVHGHIMAECPIPEASQLSLQEKIQCSITAYLLGNFNQGQAVQIALVFEDEYVQQ